MLHDLRCTYENPATYENVLLRQSQQMENNPSFNNRNSNVPQSFGRTSIKNDDGTMIEIVKEKNMKGKEELIELKYDPQGNIISRKKADPMGLRNFQNDDDLDNISEGDEFNYDFENDSELRYDNNNNTYYEVNDEVEEIRRKPSIIIETAEAKEIIYEAPAQYDPHVTINKPIEQVTILGDNGGLSDGALDNIIRNTLTMNNDSNSYNISQDNNLNNGGEYNYSQNNDYNLNEYNQSYNTNNYDGQNNNMGNNDIYNNQSYQMDNNSNAYNNSDFNFDYQY
jgi:hypothetical protein